MITTPEDAADYILDKLRTKAGELGLASVEFTDKLIGEYPAVVVTPGGKNKTFHTTHKFEVVMEVFLAVYHANLTISNAKRTREDLELCTAIEALFEGSIQNMTWWNGDNVEQVNIAWIRDQVPGVIPRPKGDAVVGTRMIMEIRSQQLFK